MNFSEYELDAYHSYMETFVQPAIREIVGEYGNLSIGHVSKDLKTGNYAFHYTVVELGANGRKERKVTQKGKYTTMGFRQWQEQETRRKKREAALDELLGKEEAE